jgi:hypothetical protein
MSNSAFSNPALSVPLTVANGGTNSATASDARTALGLAIGTNVQAYNANLTTFAGIAPSANVQTLLGAANYAAFKTSLSLNNVENTAISTFAGSSSITTLGTISTGTWSATTVAVNKGGTGQTSYTDGQLLIGNTTGNTLAAATLTGTANQVVVTNGGGTITLSTPQSIGTGSTPTFAGMSLGTSNLSTVGNISLDGSAARDATVARAASGAGVNLTVQAGGSQSGSTNQGGGSLILSSGISSGNVRSGIKFQTTTQGSSGTSDASPAVVAALFSNSSTNPVFALGGGSNGASYSTTGAPVGSNAFLVHGNIAGGFGSYRHTTSNTAGNSLTVQAAGATSGATDKAGGDLILVSGVSTGTGGSNIRLQTYTRALSTGTSDNTATDRIIVTSPKSITDGSATTLVSLTLAAGSTTGGCLRYTIEVTNGTDFQVETGEVFISGYNKAGVFGVTATEVNSQQNLSSGTLTTAWAISSANPAVVSVNADTSLTATTGYPRITYTYENYGQQAVTIA